jgi:RNA polymerase sigma factor (sigma-70 family)
MTTSTTAPSDADLVARSLEGNRDAYAAIVRKYQSVVCALTYAACGDRHRSEDLAQETFLAAWKSLGQLKEPERLCAWLRGIARNVVSSAQRKLATRPMVLPTPEGDTLASTAPTPSDRAITREEETLLWENLQRLPEDYREPMVLYYREQESVAAVAKALEISEDAARQRLSRGRAMLARRIEHLIDRGLRQSAPGQGFAIAVIAALPGMTLTKAAATLGASAKAASTASTGGIGTVFSAFFGPIIGLGSGYLGYRIGLQQTIAPEERQFIRRFFRGILLLALCFGIALLIAIYGTRWGGWSEHAMAMLILTMSALYAAAVVGAGVWYSIRLPRLRAQLLAERPELGAAAQSSAKAWAIQYRSRWRLLGLPLIDINIGSTADGRPAVAKGWIAIGAKAYGLLIAVGAIAIAPVSWGGCSIGVLTWGGFAVGIWTVGAIAVGWKAVGVTAAGWHGAQGIVAAAYRYADGMVAVAAHHANDARAREALGNETFFRAWEWIAVHGNWIWLIGLLAVSPVLHRAWKLRRMRRETM